METVMQTANIEINISYDRRFMLNQIGSRTIMHYYFYVMKVICLMCISFIKKKNSIYTKYPIRSSCRIPKVDRKLIIPQRLLGKTHRRIIPVCFYFALAHTYLCTKD